MAKLDGAVGPESALDETLEALKDAARSIRNLTDYLERHPEAVLTGKDN
jgi:paraquat-inducible protein B